MLPTLIDPSWAVVCMLLALFLGMVGGVRLITLNANHSSSGGNRMPSR